jgi:hypothetical protein
LSTATRAETRKETTKLPDATDAASSELRRAGLTAIALLAMLNIADVAITRLLLARDGVELNPVAERLLASNLALVTKLGIVATLAIHFVRHGPRLSAVALMWFVAGVYVCVVVLGGSQLVAVWNS